MQTGGGDAETNFAVKTLDATNLSQTGITDKAKGSESGASIVGNLIGSLQIKNQPMVITCTEAAQSKLSHSTNGNLKFIIEDEATIDATIDQMLGHVKDQKLTDDSLESYDDLPTDHGKFVLDFTDCGAGTYYVQVDRYPALKAAFGKEAQYVTIKKHSNQTIVFNYAESTDARVLKYEIVNDGTSYTSDSLAGLSTKDSQDLAEQLIFAMPKATSVSLSNFCGILLAPNATVNVSDVGGGWLVANQVNLGCEWHFTNGNLPDVFHGTTAKLEARKTIDGKEATVSGFNFNLYQKQNDGTWNQIASTTNNGSSVDFGTLNYNDNNDGSFTDQTKTYYYKITEQSGNNGTVTISSNGTNTVYTTDPTAYFAKIVIKGTRESKNGQNVYGVEVVSKEYYDNEACTGTPLSTVPTFNNTTRQPKTMTASISAVKSLTGRALKDGEFSFTLTAKDNAPMPEGAKDGKLTVTNKGTAVDFGSITYDKAGNYSYTIKEVKGSLDGVTYDENTKDVTVAVIENSDGTLSATVSGDGKDATFENKYSAGATTASISAVKSLSGRALKDGEFSFTLTAKDNAPMPEGTKDGKLTVTNNGTAVDFGTITYDRAGTYRYTITEDAGSVSGVTYDTSTKDVTVTVTDDGKGNLNASVAGDGEAATFRNTYKAETTSASISAVKSLTGRALKDGEFSFTLTAKDNAPMPEGAKDGKLTVTNDGTAVNFGSIKYDKAGTYRYTITEDAGNISGVTYDDSTKNVTVTVTDDGKGNLNASVAGDGEAATFRNTYKAGTTSAAISAVKKGRQGLRHQQGNGCRLRLDHV